MRYADLRKPVLQPGISERCETMDTTTTILQMSCIRVLPSHFTLLAGVSRDMPVLRLVLDCDSWAFCPICCGVMQEESLMSWASLSTPRPINVRRIWRRSTTINHRWRHVRPLPTFHRRQLAVRRRHLMPSSTPSSRATRRPTNRSPRRRRAFHRHCRRRMQSAVSRWRLLTAFQHVQQKCRKEKKVSRNYRAQRCPV